MNLAILDIEPARVPMKQKGRITPKQKTTRISGKASGERRGNIAMKIGARQGSRK